MQRVKTGIEGLDAMLYGGIPDGSQIILAGGPGAGKTLLSFEFVYKNAKAGNISIFFSLEEEPERVIANAKETFPEFTDIDDLIKSGKLIVTGEDIAGMLYSGSDSSPYWFGKVISNIESFVTSTKATRVVIDSLSVMSMLISDPLMYRRSMLSLIGNLRRMDVTAVLTSEIANPEKSGQRFSQEFFLFDGIILMYETGEGDRRMLAIETIKMRGSKHSFVTTPYEITPKGFNIVSAEQMDYFT